MLDENKTMLKDVTIPEEVSKLILEIAPPGEKNMKGIQIGKQNLLEKFYLRLQSQQGTVESPILTVNEIADDILGKIFYNPTLETTDQTPEILESYRETVIVELARELGRRIGNESLTNASIFPFTPPSVDAPKTNNISVTKVLIGAFVVAVVTSSILEILRILKIF